MFLDLDLDLNLDLDLDPDLNLNPILSLDLDLVLVLVLDLDLNEDLVLDLALFLLLFLDLDPVGRVVPRFLHGGGLAGPVVSQEGGDLAAVELEGQSVHSQLVAVAVDLDQVLDVDAGLDVRRLLLDADRWFIAQQSSLHQNNNNQHEIQRRRQ